MPTYCYMSERTGQIVEEVFPMGKQPLTLDADGSVFKRCYSAEGVAVPSPAGWPMTCCASGVHGDQAGELRDHLAGAGVPTEVTRDGDPIYTDAKHRKKALKARGMFDKAAYS